MKKVDFSKIEMVLKLGKKIYYADGEIELSDKEIEIVKNAVAGWSYVARTAIIDAMKEK